MAAQFRVCLGGRASVVFDPDPAASPASPWRTYRHALELTPVGATHRLIVQDDAIVADHFLDAVDLAVAERPDRLLLFFVPGTPPMYLKAMQDACFYGETWTELVVRTWIPVVAACWPLALIQPLLDFDAEKRRAKLWPLGFVADDEIVGRFITETGQRPPLACVPSIVEHPDSVPSIMNGHRRVGDGRDPGRRAAIWIGDYPDCYGCDARRVFKPTG